jgi:hypothetical protein
VNISARDGAVTVLDGFVTALRLLCMCNRIVYSFCLRHRNSTKCTNVGNKGFLAADRDDPTAVQSELLRPEETVLCSRFNNVTFLKVFSVQGKREKTNQTIKLMR